MAIPLMTRLLLVSRRIVPLDALEDYGSRWARVVAAVSAAGGRAWVFRGVRHQDHFLEFIEWRTDHSVDPGALPDRESVAAARAELDGRFGPASDDEWEEALLEHV